MPPWKLAKRQVKTCRTGLNFAIDIKAEKFSDVIIEQIREVHYSPNQISNKIQDKMKDKTKKGKKGKITKADIGLQSKYQRVSHIGWNPNKGFVTNSMDPTVKKWFKSIGLTEANNHKTNYNNDFIEQHGNIKSVKKEAGFDPVQVQEKMNFFMMQSLVIEVGTEQMRKYFLKQTGIDSCSQSWTDYLNIMIPIDWPPSAAFL
ncbi:neural Wiskott-Aldrich syndrome protein-like [Anneissia japonica]|uniref:neural Wiskott-Aldrich syndrome protein-like n=1 Tax=Anneissia japonica TaxID=1529436 RepID=UPI0014259F18|nr:neural Wiskott-Aldrich syndrome protein-like [Anneissia japonica]